jgi:hypothetical protein
MIESRRLMRRASRMQARQKFGSQASMRWMRPRPNQDGLLTDLRARLQGGWRRLRQDRLPCWLPVNGDNECEKVQDKKPVATREDSTKRDRERKQTEATPSTPQASGQITCNNAGCRPVRKGCHLEKAADNTVSGLREVCN